MPRPPPSLQSLEFPRSDPAPPRPKPPGVACYPSCCTPGTLAASPLLRVPAAPAGSKGTAGALTSRATDPGRTGPDWAVGPRVLPHPPGRCLRRREPEKRLRREAASQARAPQAGSGRGSVFSGGGALSLRSRSAPESFPLPALSLGHPDGNTSHPQQSSAASSVVLSQGKTHDGDYMNKVYLLQRTFSGISETKNKKRNKNENKKIPC